jgi:hypothetical protein
MQADIPWIPSSAIEVHQAELTANRPEIAAYGHSIPLYSAA